MARCTVLKEPLKEPDTAQEVLTVSCNTLAANFCIHHVCRLFSTPMCAHAFVRVHINERVVRHSIFESECFKISPVSVTNGATNVETCVRPGVFPYLQASIVAHKSPVEGKSKIDANCGGGGEGRDVEMNS